VVLVVDRQRARGACALRSILDRPSCRRSRSSDRSGQPDHPPLPGRDDLVVRIVPEDRGRSCGEVMARAVHKARAPIVAFVEEHVLVLPGWAEAIVRAHARPCGAVCGEMHAGDLGRRDARLIELVSRDEWSAPARRGEVMCCAGRT
jgi:hypothetical protein